MTARNSTPAKPRTHRAKGWRPGFYDDAGQEAFSDAEADQLVDRITAEIRARGADADRPDGYGAWKVGPFHP